MASTQNTRTVELTDTEIFILQCALEGFRDIDDSEFAKATKMAEKLYKKLPDTDITWNDVAS